MKLQDFIDYLVCPAKHRSLKIVQLASGDSRGRGDLAAIPRKGAETKPFGATERLMFVEDGTYAYPVIDEIPVLLAPEKLVDKEQAIGHPAINLNDPKYEEAYEEMEFYNYVGEERRKSASADNVNSVMGPLVGYSDIETIAATFPKPADIWIDARHDSLSQFEAYLYLAPVCDKVFMQLGGSGSHSVKALLAGAKQAFLLTPMLGEARFAMQLAANFNVADRLACVLGIGEELPFANSSIDLIYSGGCFHHMRLENVASQLHRVLKEGGKFSGVDPWKTPLHTVGTKVIGKRETSVYCRPITAERLAPIQARFHDMIVNRHGPFLRYVFLGLEKAHITLSTPTMMKVMYFDDLLGWPLSLKDKYGGSLVIAGTR